MGFYEGQQKILVGAYPVNTSLNGSADNLYRILGAVSLYLRPFLIGEDFCLPNPYYPQIMGWPCLWNELST
jgi:hypothetical protein